jgi:hypothetical protein
MRWTTSLALLMLFGCLPDLEERVFDGDQDGYEVNLGDCNDDHPDIYPGAPEYCDDIDNDCDGDTDEDPTDGEVFWVDSDEDGFGDESVPTVAACEIEKGLSRAGGDCDDTNHDLNPNTNWYPDEDQDSYGDDEASPSVQCEPPYSSFVRRAGDCDDTDWNINPEGTETCDDDDDDEDCNGFADDEDLDAVGKVWWWLDADGDGYGAGRKSAAQWCDMPDEDGLNWAPNEDDCQDDPEADGALYHPLTIWYLDQDGDDWGDSLSSTVSCQDPSDATDVYVLAKNDCFPENPDAYPNAPELCNDEDDDCDGTPDDPPWADAQTWYLDADGDGYGKDNTAVERCDGGTSEVLVGGDCDDTNELLNPETYWYPDIDEDGWGASPHEHQGCEYAAEKVAYRIEDCRPEDPSIHPGMPETPNDGIDQDCTGLDWRKIDDGGVYSLASFAAVSGTAEEERLGTGLAGVGHWDGTGDDYYLALGGRGHFWQGGAVYLMPAPSSGVVVSAATAPAVIIGDPDIHDGEPGLSIDVGQVDGDGYPDLLLGVHDFDIGARNEGAAYVLAGSHTGTIDLGCESCDLRRLHGETYDQYFAYSAIFVGNLDGIGGEDVIVGSPATGGFTGAAYYLTDVDFNTGGSVSDTRTGVMTTESHDQSGYSMARAGDVNGDGEDDLLIGAPLGGSQGAGRVYLLHGSDWSGTTDLLTEADAEFRGRSWDYAGTSVAGAGDVNGDGYADILIGAPAYFYGTNDKPGRVYLLYGPVEGVIEADDADAELIGESDNDRTGTSVAGPGDVDGDGLDDLLIGAPAMQVNAVRGGGAYLVTEAPTGAKVLMAGGIRLEAPENEAAGSAVRGAADIDGDGYVDFLIGAPDRSSDGLSENGRVYVVYSADFVPPAE